MAWAVLSKQFQFCHVVLMVKDWCLNSFECCKDPRLLPMSTIATPKRVHPIAANVHGCIIPMLSTKVVQHHVQGLVLIFVVTVVSIVTVCDKLVEVVELQRGRLATQPIECLGENCCKLGARLKHNLLGDLANGEGSETNNALVRLITGAHCRGDDGDEDKRTTLGDAALGCDERLLLNDVRDARCLPPSDPCDSLDDTVLDSSSKSRGESTVDTEDIREALGNSNGVFLKSSLVITIGAVPSLSDSSGQSVCNTVIFWSLLDFMRSACLSSHIWPIIFKSTSGTGTVSGSTAIAKSEAVSLVSWEHSPSDRQSSLLPAESPSTSLLPAESPCTESRSKSDKYFNSTWVLLRTDSVSCSLVGELGCWSSGTKLSAS